VKNLATLDLHSDAAQPKLREIFQSYDLENAGVIGPGSVTKILRAMYPGISRRKLTSMLPLIPNRTSFDQLPFVIESAMEKISAREALNESRTRRNRFAFRNGYTGTSNHLIQEVSHTNNRTTNSASQDSEAVQLAQPQEDVTLISSTADVVQAVHLRT